MDPLVDGETLAQSCDPVQDLPPASRIIEDGLEDQLAHFLHLRLLEAPGGDGGRAEPQAAGLLRPPGIRGHGVLVGGDMQGVQPDLQFLAAQIHILQVHQHQVVVGAAGDQLQTAVHQRLGQGGGVGHDLVLIGLEIRAEDLSEGHGLGGDDVHQGAALNAGEDGAVDLPGDHRVVGEDNSAAGSAHGLMGGGGDHVRIGHGRGMLPCRHQAGNVGHIHHQERAHFPGDTAESSIVDDPGIGGCTGDDHFRMVGQSQFPHLIVIDPAGGGIHAVGDDIVVLSGEIRLAAVGQMAAVIQRHAHDRIPGLAEGQIHGVVGLGTAVGLYIGVFGVENELGPLDADILRHIHIFAAAVEPVAGIPLGILVREYRGHGGHDFLADQVFRGDEFDIVSLTLELQVQDLCDLRVVGADVAHAGFYHVALQILHILLI